MSLAIHRSEKLPQLPIAFVDCRPVTNYVGFDIWDSMILSTRSGSA